MLVSSRVYGSYLSQNTSLMEHLASLGYVVFSIAHPYDDAVVFPDGRTPGVGNHFKTWTKCAVENMAQAFGEMEWFVKTTDQDERREMLEEVRRQGGGGDVADGLGLGLSWVVWLEDWNRFFDVLDELA